MTDRYNDFIDKMNKWIASKITDRVVELALSDTDEIKKFSHADLENMAEELAEEVVEEFLKVIPEGTFTDED